MYLRFNHYFVLLCMQVLLYLIFIVGIFLYSIYILVI